MLKWPATIHEITAHYASATFGQTDAGCHSAGQLVFGSWREGNILAASSFCAEPRVEDGVIHGSIFCRIFAALRDGPITVHRPEDVLFEGEVSVKLPTDLSKAILSWDAGENGFSGQFNTLAATSLRHAAAAKCLKIWRRLQSEAGEPLVFASYPTAADIGCPAPSEIRIGLLPRFGVQKTIRALEPRIREASKREVYYDGDNLAWQRVLLS